MSSRRRRVWRREGDRVRASRRVYRTLVCDQRPRTPRHSRSPPRCSPADRAQLGGQLIELAMLGTAIAFMWPDFHDGPALSTTTLPDRRPSPAPRDRPGSPTDPPRHRRSPTASSTAGALRWACPTWPTIKFRRRHVSHGELDAIVEVLVATAASFSVSDFARGRSNTTSPRRRSRHSRDPR